MPQTLNPYAYGMNNPVRFTDPSGNCIGPTLWICLFLADVAMDIAPVVGAFIISSLALSADSIYNPTTPEEDQATALAIFTFAPLTFPAFTVDPWRIYANEINAYNSSLAERPNSLPVKDVCWGQGAVNPLLSDKARALSNKSITEVAQMIRNGETSLPPLNVFEKQPWMDNFPPQYYISSAGKVYTGNWSAMNNGSIYTLNNRGFTAAVMAGQSEIQAT